MLLISRIHSPLKHSVQKSLLLSSLVLSHLSSSISLLRVTKMNLLMWLSWLLSTNSTRETPLGLLLCCSTIAVMCGHFSSLNVQPCPACDQDLSGSPPTLAGNWENLGMRLIGNTKVLCVSITINWFCYFCYLKFVHWYQAMKPRPFRIIDDEGAKIYN